MVCAGCCGAGSRRCARSSETQPSPQRDPGEPLRLAAITFAATREAGLPRWLRHYGGECGSDNLYVVDDNCEDGSTDGLPCVGDADPVVRGQASSSSTRMAVVGRTRGGGCSRRTTWCYSADTDEFLSPPTRTRHAGLSGPTREPAWTHAGARIPGLNVVHNAGAEQALDPDRPLLGQRQFGEVHPADVQAVAQDGPPSRGSWARTGLTIPFGDQEPDLYLFHLKFAEREHLRATGDQPQGARPTPRGGRRPRPWQFAGDDLVVLLDEITRGVTDVAAVQEFRAPGRVAGWRGWWSRTVNSAGAHPKGSQVELMRSRPLVRIPERFHGIVSGGVPEHGVLGVALADAQVVLDQSVVLEHRRAAPRSGPSP